MQSICHHQKPKNQGSGGDSVTELLSIYGETKTFHGKAMIEQTPNGEKLYSYNCLVAEIIGKNAIIYECKTDSTFRHIVEFLKSHRFQADNKKQIIADYFKTV